MFDEKTPDSSREPSGEQTAFRLALAALRQHVTDSGGEPGISSAGYVVSGDDSAAYFCAASIASS